MTVKSFLQLTQQSRSDICLAVAGADDAEVLDAVVMALDRGLIASAILCGDRIQIRKTLPDRLRSSVELVPAGDAAVCAGLAVSAVRSGDAQILMKGHIDSASYLRAVVHRDVGIRQSGLLSNVTVAEMPSYPKLIAATDNGIVPVPTLQQKRQIILNTAELYRGLGVSEVRVAAVAASEKVSDAMPATTDAAALTLQSRQGKLPGFIVDGPFGYDVAVSHAAAKSKGLTESPVAGGADLLLFSNIEAANSVVKAWKFHGDAKTGSLVLGAQVPVLLNSRSDSAERRLNSLLLGVAAMPKSL
ncbi:phosphate butyryltransferase [Halomonas campisalis]|uniref:Phosphate butyryltransferase n=1 Tax=Billgrantia campisalis TaxID=74661 RepID=A0ABS9PBI4_9GAMM|nr:phosphate acyltransferase [Halomonas campisalis]MCG6659112.1 phosphate butyryltransferase [Halomonas campisalis]MDR5863853.1 phosphate acyltransferase [Halomonas campisalis]